MKFKSALRNMSQLQALTKGLLLSNIILGFGAVYSIVHFNNQHDRTVLVPPNLDAKAVIAWNHADREYLKSFGLYIASMVGNIQPKSSTVVLDAVSAFMDPSIYADFRRQLLAVIEDPVFKASGSVISFLPATIQYEAETNRVFVTGTLITSTSGAQKYNKQVVYEIGAAIRSGRPWVTHFLSYEGSIPRTVTWHVTHAQKDGKPIPDYALPLKDRKSKGASEPVEPAADLGAMRDAFPPAASSDGAASRPIPAASAPEGADAEHLESKEPS